MILEYSSLAFLYFYFNIRVLHGAHYHSKMTGGAGGTVS